MNIAWILSIAILLLDVYGWISTTISDHRRKNKATEKSNKGKRDLDSILHLTAWLIFCLLLLHLLVAYIEIMALIFLFPTIVIYALVVLSASSTVGSLAMSPGNTPLTKDEVSSVLFVGMLVGFVSLSRAASWSNIVAGEKTLVQCICYVLEYSAYLFVAGTLAIKPIKDIAKLVEFCADRLKKPFKQGARIVCEKVVPRKLKKAYSELVKEKQRKAKGWKKLVWYGCFAFSIPFDIVGYFLQCVAIALIWLPLLCLAAIISMLGRCVWGITQWINRLSNRRVIVISFRASIVVAMLLLVGLNEYKYIVTSQATTSVLEFVASVVIIPVVFEWIHEALKSKN